MLSITQPVLPENQKTVSIFTQNTVISPNFLLEKFCGNAQCKTKQNSAETAILQKLTPGN